MQLIDSVVVVSPSDLIGFLACEHLSALDLAVAQAKLAPPQGDDPELDLLARLGDEHEGRYLESLESKGLGVVRIDRPAPGLGIAGLLGAADATEQAMAEGAEVIYQATFFDGQWVGYADFLRRVPEASGRWGWGYEVWDTKLARRVQAKALLGVCCYSEQLGRVQASRPTYVHIVTGDAEAHRYRLADFDAFTARTMARFSRWLADRDSESATTYPEPVSHCGLCRWDQECSSRRRDDDHLSLVAGITARQRSRLQSAGIASVANLAVRGRDEKVPGLSSSVALRLGRQARLQIESRSDGVARYELIIPAVGPSGLGEGGLSLLPEPDDGDVFFDIEGDPFALEGGLEYLFGLYESKPEARYLSWWGHDLAGERRVLEQFVDYVTARRLEHPRMHIYHYASYEQSAVGRLAARHGTRQDEVDDLLRSGVFVDLFTVARQALVISEESYSLKKLERFYMPARKGAIKDAGSSVVAYEAYLASPGRLQKILDDIEGYNEVDCYSTMLLRDWLEGRRTELAQELGETLCRPEPSGTELPSEVLAARAEVDALALELSERGWELVGHLLDWHRREDRPEWWEYFRRMSLTDQELIEDPEALGGLVWMSEVGRQARSSIHRYRFPPDQEFKIQIGSQPENPASGKGAGTIIDLDRSDGWIDIKRATHLNDRPSALVPRRPISTGVLQEGLIRFGAWLVSQTRSDATDHATDRATDHATDRATDRAPDYAVGTKPDDANYGAVVDLLLRRPPRIKARLETPEADQAGHAADQAGHAADQAGHAADQAWLAPDQAGLAPDLAPSGQPIPLARPGESASDTAVRVTTDLDGGCLVVQGPPGSGKTFTGARMVLEVIKQGGRVGITALSHNAISNLVTAVLGASEDAGYDVTVLQKGSADQAVSHDRVIQTDDSKSVATRLFEESIPVVAGTPWLFARADMANALTHLFVDEAGQLSLANVVAMAGAGDNLVLLGDPQQLAQPSKGVHPDGAGASGLGHFLGPFATVRPEAGIFLDETWRMHPEVTAYISSVFYESRLTSRSECALQRIELACPGTSGLPGGSGAAPDLNGAGLRWIPVAHSDCTTASDEEVDVVAGIVDRLAGARFTNAAGQVVPLDVGDIMVLAPYNDQVNRITAALPPGARVGTVDRFQGQEAVVVIYSLTTSSPAGSHRGMEFLYSTHRLNVAVSRARAMAILVGNPALLEPECKTPEQMRMANALCHFVDLAS